MSRPPSIVRFERLYLASFGLGLVGWVVSWETLSRRLSTNPQTAPFEWILPVGVLLGALLTLALLYLVARRASVVAQWIAVVLAGLGVLRFLLNIPAVARGVMTPGELMLALVALVLSVAAAVQLFRPDSRLWFGENAVGNVA